MASHLSWSYTAVVSAVDKCLVSKELPAQWDFSSFANTGPELVTLSLHSEGLAESVSF